MFVSLNAIADAVLWHLFGRHFRVSDVAFFCLWTLVQKYMVQKTFKDINAYIQQGNIKLTVKTEDFTEDFYLKYMLFF